MRKLFLTLALLLSLAVATPAGAFGFDWGITGGLNLTKLRLSDNLKNVFSSDNQAGWFIGPKVNLSLVAGLGLDASLQYSQRKLQVSDDEGQSNYKTFRSIEIPINVKYNFGVGRVASIYVATGPQFGFNVGSRSWNSSEARTTDSSATRT